MKEIKSFYDLLEVRGFTKDEINEVVDMLRSEDKNILLKRYNNGLDKSPDAGQLSKEESMIWYRKVLPNIKKILEEKRKIPYNNEYLPPLKFSVISRLSPQEAFIIIGVFGYMSKNISIREMSDFLDISEVDILVTCRKYMEEYVRQTNINPKKEPKNIG